MVQREKCRCADAGLAHSGAIGGAVARFFARRAVHIQHNAWSADGDDHPQHAKATRILILPICPADRHSAAVGTERGLNPGRAC